MPFSSEANPMRIDDNRMNNNAPLGASTAASMEKLDGQRKSQGSSGSVSRDSVAVSDLTNLLTHLGSQAGMNRSEIVSRVAAQYHSGRYVVDTAALGDALIASAFEG
jgi:anti-sigma28 factor (negative regulator of flagellin synthesis)